MKRSSKTRDPGSFAALATRCLPHAAKHVDLARDDQLEGGVRARRPHQLSALKIPAQKQIVRAASRRANAYSLAIDVRDRAQRRARGHEIGPFDFYIGRGEINFTRALRIDGEKRDIPGAGFQRVEHLPRGLEADKFDRHADTLAEFSPQIGRHAMKRSTGRVSPRQYRVGIVDADAQCARRRKIIS